MFVVQDPDY